MQNSQLLCIALYLRPNIIWWMSHFPILSRYILPYHPFTLVFPIYLPPYIHSYAAFIASLMEAHIPSRSICINPWRTHFFLRSIIIYLHFHYFPIRIVADSWNLYSWTTGIRLFFKVNIMICWWPGEARGQGIYGHVVNSVILAYSRFSTARVNTSSQSKPWIWHTLNL